MVTFVRILSVDWLRLPVFWLFVTFNFCQFKGTKRAVYQAIVLAVLLYGAETWTPCHVRHLTIIIVSEPFWGVCMCDSVNSHRITQPRDAVTMTDHIHSCPVVYDRSCLPTT